MAFFKSTKNSANFDLFRIQLRTMKFAVEATAEKDRLTRFTPAMPAIFR